MTLALLTLVCALTYSFEIVFGLAGTIFMLPILRFWFDTKTLIIYSVLPQVLVAVIGLWRSPGRVDRSFVAGMLAWAVAGGAAGLIVFSLLPESVYQVALAAVVIVFGLALALGPHGLPMPAGVKRALDAGAGASQALFGLSGPIYMIRLLSTFANKTQVRNHALAFFLPLNLFRGASYVVTGDLTDDIVTMMLVSAPFLIGALWLADRLHFAVPDSAFRRVVAWMIVLGGATLLYR